MSFSLTSKTVNETKSEYRGRMSHRKEELTLLFGDPRAEVDGLAWYRKYDEKYETMEAYVSLLGI